ncbi:hypothetical protein [Streptomyces sp. H39-C1]|uniref:hypothetical protein n=1 Tax=Streptomyces sp. H39-C1 TaxID=3004355 RepID=UPI0022AF129A|nr:hypothetical protein [Streptomyces sp. H39-C1]MCZ4103673.1 hypothetical protein [Streptomyces sp. H39-C1]
MTLAALAGTAVVITAVWTLTAQSTLSMAERFSDAGQLLNLGLATLRACSGTDSLVPEQDSSAHQLLATITSITGALVPAGLLSIVLIKMFALQPFVWRERASISGARTAHFRNYAQQHATSDNSIIAVRFYNRFDNLSVVDLRARVHLRYLELPTPLDSSLVIYKKRLQVLNEEGVPAGERYWWAVERGAPCTLWIPVESPVLELPLARIQGKDLAQSYNVKLVVRLTAYTTHLGTEVAAEKWFDLTTDDDFELGRFAPVRPDPGKDVWLWEGWTDFDSLLPPPSPSGGTPGEPTSPAS